MLICNSNVRHELSSSQYPLRRAQCTEALRLMGLDSYKDATLSNLDGKLHALLLQLDMPHSLYTTYGNAFLTFAYVSAYFVALKNGRQVLIKRARHVITETNRTQEAAEALKRRDFIKVYIKRNVYLCSKHKVCLIIGFHVPI